MILPVIERKMYFLKIKRINFGKNFCINKKKKKINIASTALF